MELAKSMAKRGAGKGKMMEAVKLQKYYRRKIMNQQVEDSKLMAFSEDKKPYNLQQLINNLTRVIELS